MFVAALQLFFFFSLVTSQGFPEEENDDPRLFGGDMMLTPWQRDMIMKGGDIGPKENAFAAISNKSQLWLANNKVVPWIVSEQLEDQAEATFGLMAGLREWEENSCLTFKRRTTEKDFIAFFQGSGCWSYVGKQGGYQNVSLADGCWGVGTVVHEIGHAMGFGHEQNRPDRDQYIKIRWENIPKKKEHNFKKYNNSRVDSMGSPYDFKSFMQYSKTAFGINNTVTLDPKPVNVFQLGQRLGFTKHDTFQAMTLYQCNGKTTRPATKPKTYDLKGDITCDFERDMCGFSQDTTDDFDWSQRYGGTPSGNTGPDTDHTTGRMGVFAYMETSAPQKQGDIARLKSRFYDTLPSVQCFSFFYSMYAHNATMMGAFRVYYNDALNKDKVVFSQNGTRDNNEWQQVNIQFKPKSSFQFVFEGIRGSGYQGDIAVDDISITKGACKKPSMSPKPKDSGPCEDIKDREAKYCSQWEKAGFCKSRESAMRNFCKKTCKFC